jgi:PAS domain-containing protein
VSATIHTLSCEDAIAFVCDSTTPFAEIDAGGRFVWLNRAYCEVLNAPIELIVGTHYKIWTHESDVEIAVQLANKVRDGEIPGYTLSKKYLQRGTTPQAPRIVWGMLTVSGKWLETREFSGYRVQFQPYAKQSVEQQISRINWRETGTWVVTNWKTLVTIAAVSMSLIAGSSATLLEALRKVKDTVNSVESELQSSPSGVSPQRESPP